MESKLFTVFVSSVQKEFEEERRAIKYYLLNDPLFKLFITDVFLFEDTPAQDQQADKVYLSEVERCDIYIGLFGNEYGYVNSKSVSPTEREFNKATEKNKYRIIFVKGQKDTDRHPKMRALIRKAGDQLIRRRFIGKTDLISALYASLIDYLKQRGLLSALPFDESYKSGVSIKNISKNKIIWFLELARIERGFSLKSGTAPQIVLEHLNLLREGKPINAAILLFSDNPQKFFSNAEVKCLHFHGTEVQKPIPSYQIYKGNIFEQVDQSLDFVMSKLTRSVGTRSKSAEAPVEYEIPRSAVAEAIVNAVAHRDYYSKAAIQVMLFSDRLEVWNPGHLPPGLTLALLRIHHQSVPHNPLIANPLYLTHYIEKAGTGILDMIRLCKDAGLPEPDYEQRGDQFVTTIWRDWLTSKALENYDLKDGQLKAIQFVKKNGRISNSDYRELTGLPKKTATRHLEELVKQNLFTQVGKTGRGVYYIPSKRRHKEDK